MKTLLLLCQLLAPAVVASAQTPINIDLPGAFARARANSQQYLSVVENIQIAGEDIKQSRAALLPKTTYNNQFLYTQGNLTESGRFIGANGVHEYVSLGVVEETLSQTTRLQYRQAIIGEVVAKAREEVARRGLTTVVIQNYYALVAAQRRLANATQSLDEAKSFLESTRKLESNGEVAHLAVMQAERQPLARQREVENANLEIERAQIELAVLIFPNYNTAFTVTDDLESMAPLMDLSEVSSRVTATSPDLSAAKNVLQQQTLGISIAKSDYIPTMTIQYAFGIDANQFALHTDGRPNLGNSVVATLNIPIFNWGITKSRIRQAETRQKQAALELSRTEKDLSAGMQLLYREAQLARSQMNSLKASVDLATETERLTRLAYAAGEVSVLEVLEAQRTLTESREAYDQGLARYQVAWANIQVMTGAF